MANKGIRYAEDPRRSSILQSLFSLIKELNHKEEKKKIIRKT